MTLDDALAVVKEKYALLDAYVTPSGKMVYVVAAVRELRAIPAVELPERGIALFAPEVIELAQGAATIGALVKRKNPELFRE
jgi:hypothetical protein